MRCGVVCTVQGNQDLATYSRFVYVAQSYYYAIWLHVVAGQASRRPSWPDFRTAGSVTQVGSGWQNRHCQRWK